MIHSFHDRETQIIFRGEGYDKKAEKQLPLEKWDDARSVLEALDSAESLEDLEQYRPDRKKGNLKGWWSLDIDRKHRVLFRWDSGVAREVFAGDPDYH